jgi:hypothetical protein
VNYDALIKFAPVFTHERFNDVTWARPGRRMYERGALEFMPGWDSIPLIVDHDDEREIGVVHRFGAIDWVDGPWLYAVATVTDPPSWLKRGTRASFESRPFDQRDVIIREHRAEVVARAFVSEVSVLSPSVKPAEPLAEVLSLRAAEPAGEVIYHTSGVLVRRYYANAVVGIR